ncbi:hypothetical protein [Moorena sp. SIOASIH]|uniref:hypothetical protein n=1 Tax=Moorena sp. SIOASIH TaxID=2607817 RepID=UPI0025E8FE70|nr:hypothetical protein [Moorena sp. SIOASIH]
MVDKLNPNRCLVISYSISSLGLTLTSVPFSRLLIELCDQQLPVWSPSPFLSPPLAPSRQISLNYSLNSFNIECLVAQIPEYRLFFPPFW